MLQALFHHVVGVKLTLICIYGWFLSPFLISFKSHQVCYLMSNIISSFSWRRSFVSTFLQLEPHPFHCFPESFFPEVLLEEKFVQNWNLFFQLIVFYRCSKHRTLSESSSVIFGDSETFPLTFLSICQVSVYVFLLSVHFGKLLLWSLLLLFVLLFIIIVLKHINNHFLFWVIGS